MTKCKHFLLVVYSDGVVCRLVKYDFATGKTAEVKLPASGTMTVSCPDWKSDRCLVAITSWTLPHDL
jgi:prolyl oligopeptidase PreP (S9A serine peptidase family)